MKNKKRSIASFLTLIFTLSCFLNLINPAWAELATVKGRSDVNNSLPKIQFTDIDKHWARGPILKLAAQGVISGVGNKKFQPDGTIKKKHALILVMKAVGLGAEAEQEALDSELPKEANEDNDAYFAKSYLAVALDREMLTQTEADNLLTKLEEPAQRQEVASWLAKGLELPLSYGTEQRIVRNFADYNKISPEYVPAIEALLKEHYMSGKGDNVFDPLGRLTRGEAAALLNNVAPKTRALQGLTLEKGKVEGITDTWQKYNYQKRIEIIAYGGQRFNLVTHSGTSAEPKGSEVFVYRNGTLGNSTILKKGDNVSFSFAADGSIGYIEATPQNVQNLDGYIKNIDLSNSLITIENESSQLISFPWTLNTEFIIENRDATINDFVIGQEVEFKIDGEVLATLVGYFGGNAIGVEEPKSKIISGRIKSLSGTTLTVLGDDGTLGAYKLTDFTLFNKQNKAITSDALKIGDRVKLTFEDFASKEVVRADVSAEAGKLVRVVKGRLQQAISAGNKVALSEVKELVNGQWKKVEDFDFLELLPEADLYAKGRKISFSQLTRGYAGQNVYLAYAESFGAQEGIKLVVEEGIAQYYSNKIDNITYGAESFDLAKDAFGIKASDATIIVRNNKLVDFDDLSKKDSVFVELNKVNNQNNSVVISAIDTPLKDSDYALYRGRIDTVDKDEFDLDYVSEFDLTDFEWDDYNPSSSDDETLTFDANTIIIDTERTGKDRQIPVEKFAESRWSEYYERYYAHVLAKDGHALAMYLYPSGSFTSDLKVLKTSLAQVTGVDNYDEKIDLARVNDWSIPRAQWIKNDYDLTLAAKDALIIRDNRRIESGSVREGDTLYILHDTQKAMMIIVQ